MIGMGSVEMALVYWLCIAASVLCVAYGVINWNQDGLQDKVTEEDEGGQG